MAALAQFVSQYEAGTRAQFVSQYLQSGTIAVGVATETDTASSVVAINPNTVVVGSAAETNTAYTVTPSINAPPVVVAIGAANETDAAFGVTVINPLSIAVGVVTEADTAYRVEVIGGTITTASKINGVPAAAAARWNGVGVDTGSTWGP